MNSGLASNNLVLLLRFTLIFKCQLTVTRCLFHIDTSVLIRYPDIALQFQSVGNRDVLTWEPILITMQQVYGPTL